MNRFQYVLILKNNIILTENIIEKGIQHVFL